MSDEGVSSLAEGFPEALGGIAYRLGRPVRWDPVKEELLNDDEANRMCGRAMREPWRL